jgi:hypothetical protein
LGCGDLSPLFLNQQEERVNSLLQKMTLEEKLGQLQMLDGDADGRFRDEHIDLIRRGLLGSRSTCAAQSAPASCSEFQSIPHV